MCCHRSSVLTHSTSFFGVSFGRVLHAADEIAPALAGTSSQAATQSEASDPNAITRDLKCRRIKSSPAAGRRRVTLPKRATQVREAR